MNVCVVITRSMDVIQDVAVFSSIENAQQFIENQDTEGLDYIEEIVRGDVESPGKVYTASWYVQSSDIHHFEGVYGNNKAAKRAAGNRGIVLERVINDRLS